MGISGLPFQVGNQVVAGCYLTRSRVTFKLQQGGCGKKVYHCMQNWRRAFMTISLETLIGHFSAAALSPQNQGTKGYKEACLD
jgi:hypothetical protein